MANAITFFAQSVSFLNFVVAAQRSFGCISLTPRGISTRCPKTNTVDRKEPTVATYMLAILMHLFLVIIISIIATVLLLGSLSLLAANTARTSTTKW